MTKKKSTKKKKDPNAPKRPLAAYMFYVKENRDNVITKNPDASFGEIGKLLGAEWKALDLEKKKKYEELHAKDKERYEKEKEIYQKTSTWLADNNDGLPPAPKKPMVAYMYFVKENRQRITEENEGVTFTEIGKILGGEWKKLTPEDRKPYEEKNKLDKIRFKNEKAEYDNKVAEINMSKQQAAAQVAAAQQQAVMQQHQSQLNLNMNQQQQHAAQHMNVGMNLNQQQHLNLNQQQQQQQQMQMFAQHPDQQMNPQQMQMQMQMQVPVNPQIQIHDWY